MGTIQVPPSLRDWISCCAQIMSFSLGSKSWRCKIITSMLPYRQFYKLGIQKQQKEQGLQREYGHSKRFVWLSEVAIEGYIMDLKQPVNPSLKRIVEIWLFGFCCGVVSCIIIHFINSGIR